MKFDEILPLSWVRVIILMFLALLSSMLFEPLLAAFIVIPPSITLSAVCVVAATNGPLYGVASGMVAGLFLDLFGTGALGMNMASFSIVGFIAGKAVRIIPPWTKIMKIAVVSPLMVLHIPIIKIISFIAGEPNYIGLKFAVNFIIINFICAVILTPIISSLEIRQRQT